MEGAARRRDTAGAGTNAGAGRSQAAAERKAAVGGTDAELRAYAAAGFTMLMASDRTAARCTCV